MKITKEALEKLDKLTLLSFVSIRNSQRSFSFIKKYRVWNVEASPVLRPDYQTFSCEMSSDLSDAICDVYKQVEKWFIDHKEITKYWTELNDAKELENL
jgi:hypothetical protein